MRFGPFGIVALILFLLWAGGFVVFHTAGFFIHILLVLAVISGAGPSVHGQTRLSLLRSPPLYCKSKQN